MFATMQPQGPPPGQGHEMVPVNSPATSAAQQQQPQQPQNQQPQVSLGRKSTLR